MFGTFLIGTVLVTSLVMIFLLVLPNNRSRSREVVPLIGAGALALAVLIAAVAGLAVSG